MFAILSKISKRVYKNGFSWKYFFMGFAAIIVLYLLRMWWLYIIQNKNIEETFKKAKVPLGSKTVMVTGGASGIGYAYSNALLDCGYNVVIVDIKNATDAASKLEQANANRKGRIHGIAGDVSHMQSMQEAFNKANSFAKDGVLDAVILNAGVDYPIYDNDVKIVETNLLGPMYGAELYVKQITNNLSQPAPLDKDYQIIITGSLAAFESVDMNLSPAYDATKAGIGQLVRSYRPVSTRYNFRINSVCPAGMVETGLTKPFIDTPEKKAGALAYMNAEGRGGIMQPEQIVPGMLEVLSTKTYNGDLIAVQPNLTFLARLEPRDEGKSFVEYGVYDERQSYFTRKYIDYKINSEYIGHRSYSSN